MSNPIGDLLADPSGTLIGWLRVLAGRATGYPKGSTIAQQLVEQCRALRYIPAQLADLVQRYPEEPLPLVTQAEVAQEDERWEDVLRIGEELRRRFPGHIQGFHLACVALRRLRRFDEAEWRALAMMRRFPRAPGAFESWGFTAQERGDIEEAARRWIAIGRRFPQAPWPQLMRAHCLGQLGRAEEGEAVLEEAVRRWPENWWSHHHYATNAERLEHWDEAAARWEVLRQRFPGRAEPYAKRALALAMAGRTAEAAALSREATFLFPRDPQLKVARETVRGRGGDPGPEPE